MESQSSSIQKLREQILNSSFYCVNNKKGLDICVDKSCKNKNPFVCSNDICQCLQNHQKCHLKRLKFFLDNFNQQKDLLTEVQNLIRKKFDSIVDSVSESEEKLLNQLNNLKQQKFHQQRSKLNNLIKSMNSQGNCQGSQIAQLLLENEEQKKSETNKIKEMIDNIKKIQSKFKQNIQKLFEEIQNQFLRFNQGQCLDVLGKSYWSQTLKHQDITVQGQKIKITPGSVTKAKLALLEPSIKQMKATEITWKMQMPQTSTTKNWIAYGIGLRSKLQQHNFNFLNYQIPKSDHGCYMISHNGYSWAHKNNEQSYKQLAFCFSNRQVITITLDIKKSQITYFSEISKQKFTQNILPSFQSYNDDFHICACICGEQDQVQILSPIETNNGIWKFKQ